MLRIAGGERHCGIQFSCHQHVIDFRRCPFFQNKPHVRSNLGIALHKSRYDAMGRVHHKSKPQLALHAARHQPDIPTGGIKLCNDSATIVQKVFSGWRERDVSRISFKQLNTQFPFDQGDLTTERRLGHMQQFSRPTKMERFRERHEIMHMPRVHLIPSKYWLSQNCALDYINKVA